MIYLYGITEPGVKAPDVAGLEDEPVSVLDAGLVAALHSRHEREALDPEPEALWRHDRVLENAMEHGPVLPARFASTFADTDALAAILEGEGTRLSAQLERVRGCVELAVRLSLPPGDHPAPQTGREYVASRMAQRDESRAAVEMALEPLAEHAVLAQRKAVSGNTTTLAASYLVRATEVDRFAEEVRELGRQHSELSLSCTGPWPPYSFVGDEAE